MPFSGHGTPMAIMNSHRLLLPVLGLPKNGCVTSQAWVCEELVRPPPLTLEVLATDKGRVKITAFSCTATGENTRLQ